MKRLFPFFLALALAAATASGARVQYIYASPTGDDQASGRSLDSAVASLPAALARARDLHLRSHRPVAIALRGGTYFLDVPLILTPGDSGLLIEGWHGERPILSGGALVGGWRPVPGQTNVWRANIPAVRQGAWAFHELFVNGRRRPRSRLPKTGFFHIDGFNNPQNPDNLPVPLDLIDPAWPRRGDVELIALQAWAQCRNQIRRLDPATHCVVLAADALPNRTETHGRFWLENVPGPLAPGEWYLDHADGSVTYCPASAGEMPDARVTAPRLTNLLVLEGHYDTPVRGIVLRGLTFADTDWPLVGGTDMDIQGASECHGALQAYWALDCAIEQCVFTRLGGFAVELGTGCQRDHVEGNDMSDLGAGGVRVGDTDMPRANAWPTRANLIADNHIHDLGRVNLPAVGILVFLSGSNLVSHNEIDHSFYTPISVGWSWGYAPTPAGGNIIEFNHLHDFGQGMLSDMGGVYTLGVQPGTIVRDNLIHDVNIFGYGGWGLYTDEGSSGLTLESNIVYHCQSAGFHQHYGETNILRNNIFAFNREAQLARTRIEKHVAFSFSNNVVIFDSGRLFTGNWGDDLIMDHNLYFDTRPDQRPLREALAAWQKRGHDLHSLIADPLFVDASEFDFRLRRHSPARQIGFVPFSLRNVGPRPGKLPPPS